MIDALKLKEKRPYCDSCGSLFGYVKSKNNEFVCRSCGHITKVNLEQSKIKNDWEDTIKETRKNVKKDKEINKDG